MRHETPRRLSIPLPIATAERTDAGGPAACLNCARELDVHQPDVQDPGRLLGTCEACHAWHLIEWDAGRPGRLVVLLPDLPDPDDGGGGDPA